MRRLPNRPRWLTWVAIIAILGNVLAGALGHAPAWGGAAGPDETAAAHLMCTGGAAAEPDAPGGGGGTPEGKTPHCALCSALAGFALPAIPVFTAVAFPSAGIFNPRRFDLAALAHQLSRGGIRSRAPPPAA
jgi:hypothetical protein